jgi:hypothetical protein
MIRAIAVAVLLFVAACKKDEPRGLPKAKAGLAEVEVSGTFDKGTTTPKSVQIVVLDTPCLPVPAGAKVMAHEAAAASGQFFVELFVPQGTNGHICLYGLDENGKVVAAAAWGKNPFVMKGEGEVEAHVTLTLQAVELSEPPKGLTASK